MKILGVILIVAGLQRVFTGEFLAGIILIVIGAFIFNKSKKNSYVQKKSKTEDNIKLNEMSNKRAFRAFEVRGVTFENRQKLLGIISAKHGSEGVGRIEFIREPDNPYDPNAIKIIFERIGHVGYVPKERAISILETLEKNNYDIKWSIHCVDSDNNENDISYMKIQLYSK